MLEEYMIYGYDAFKYYVHVIDDNAISRYNTEQDLIKSYPRDRVYNSINILFDLAKLDEKLKINIVKHIDKVAALIAELENSEKVLT